MRRGRYADILEVRPNRKKIQQGFTLIELLVTIAIIAILAGVLVSALGQAKESAKSTACKSNLRQLGYALSMYISDNGLYPNGREFGSEFKQPDFGPLAWLQIQWYGDVMTYAGVPIPNDPQALLEPKTLYATIFLCPGSPKRYIHQGTGPYSFDSPRLYHTQMQYPYGYNVRGTGGGLGLGSGCKDTDVTVPSEMIAVADALCVENAPDRWILPEVTGDRPQVMGVAGWHGRRGNIVFCDGHVDSGKTNQINARTEPARARWNRDNQPHPESWPKQRPPF